MKIPLIITITFLVFLGCRDKHLTELEFLEVKVETPYPLQVGEVLLIGRVSGLDRSNAERCGFVWSYNADSVSAWEKTLRQIAIAPPLPVGNDSFSVHFLVKQGETVYFRAYAQLGERLVFSKEIVSTALSNVVEMTGTPLVENNSATVSGRLIGLGNLPVSQYGHVYSAVNNLPTVGGVQCDTFRHLNTNNPIFESLLTGLDFNTTYYVRAFAIAGSLPPVYSPQTFTFRVRDGWERLPGSEFPTPFQDGAAVAAANGFAYAGFGINNTDGPANEILKNVWQFNPGGNGGTGSWNNLTPFSDLPIDKRTNASLFVIGDTIYTIFGERGAPGNTTAVRSFWKYDITNDAAGWNEYSIPISQNTFTNRSGAAGFVLKGKIYVGGGRKYTSTAAVYLNDFWEYDPNTGNWRKVKSLPMQTSLGIFQYGRYDATGFASDSFGYVGSGDYYGLPVNDFWKFMPPTGVQDSGKWELVTEQFPGLGRIDGVSFVIGTKAYFGCGWNISERNLSDFWEFDFTTEKWSKKTAFQGGRRRKMIGFALNGHGYAGTGIKNNGQSLNDELSSDFWRYIPEN